MRPLSNQSGFRSLLAAAALPILLAVCSSPPPPPPPPEPQAPDEVPAESVDVPADADPDLTPPPEVELPPPADWAEATLRSLTLEEKVGQMLMPFVLGDYAPIGSSSWDRITEMVDSQRIGGVITSVGTPIDVAVKLNALQRRSKVPLLVAADLETGAGFRMRGAVHLPTSIPLGGATMFPSMMAVGATGDPELAYQVGAITAREARAVGIHVPFAPVLDVNNNPDNPVINVRSFGEDPAAVATMGAMFVRGVQDNKAIATGKHFPGHGDTDVDSHIDLPLITVGRERLDSIELIPFRQAIDEGMLGIMTAHIAVPSLTEDNGKPATLSGNVLTTLLRGEMGFDGLIFTDAMDMSAIARRHSRTEAAVQAVLAGNDVILMPPSTKAAVEGVVAAVRNGRIHEGRIDTSVLRILRAKQRMGLHQERLVKIEDIQSTVGIPKNVDLAQEIANRSITVMKKERDLLPLAGTRSARVLSVTYRRTNDLLAGRYFDGRLRQSYPRLRTAVLNRDTNPAVYEGLLERARNAPLVVVSLHITAISYQGRMALPDDLAAFIETLIEENIPHVVVSFGNPYLLREFPDTRAYMLAWSSSRVSQRAAAGALLGDFTVKGRTPTALPPYFEIGDGIQLPARRSVDGR